MFLKENVTTTIRKPKNNFNIKKKEEDISNKIISPDKPPIIDPKNNLLFNMFLFNTIEIPNNNMKSNKELIKKT